MVVDDDQQIRRLILTTLHDVAGFRLVEAVDGQDAVDRAPTEAPEIILLDLDMPQMDGIKACARLRALPATARATIVMLTGSHDASTQERALAAGADLFLTKPFSPLDLLRLVDRLGAAGAS